MEWLQDLAQRIWEWGREKKLNITSFSGKVEIWENPTQRQREFVSGFWTLLILQRSESLVFELRLHFKKNMQRQLIYQLPSWLPARISKWCVYLPWLHKRVEQACFKVREFDPFLIREVKRERKISQNMKMVGEIYLKHLKIATRELEWALLNKSPPVIGLLPLAKWLLGQVVKWEDRMILVCNLP